MRLFAVLLVLSSLARANNFERVVVQRGAGGDVRDCYIWEENPDTNGNSDTLYVGMYGATQKITLLHFDLSAIPADATIIDARLIVHVSGSPGVQIEVHPITMPWMESVPTWNNFAANISPTVKTTFTSVDGRNEVNVTFAVQAMVSGQNNGLALQQVSPAPSVTMYSSDSTATALRPSLEVLFSRAQPLVESQVPPLFASCGVPFRYQLRAHAPEATEYTIDGAGPALDGASGEVTWTPVETERGAHSFSVRVTQGNRTEDLPVEIDVSCARALDVGFGCSTSGAVHGLLALVMMLRRRPTLTPTLSRRERETAS